MRKSLIFALMLLPGLLATLALAGAQAAPPGAPRVPAIPLPQWGPDILISPLAHPTISAERNPMLAVRPTNPNFVIAGWDSIQDAQYASGYGGSTDGGRSWT